MTKVRVTVPATTSNLGPGLNSMALALGLYNVVELSEIEYGLEFDLHGEGGDSLPDTPNNMVVRAAIEVFRRAGLVPSGLRVRLENNIPPGSGLGSSAAALLGGVVAANVLLGSPLDRDEMLRIAIDMDGRPNAATAALHGGLVISSYDTDELVYATVPVVPMYVIVVLPLEGERPRPDAFPQSVSLSDTIFSIGRANLVMRALSTGNYGLLRQAMQDRLHEPICQQCIPGYQQVVEIAQRYGAASVSVSGLGPALVAFSEQGHEEIAHQMARVFERVTGSFARTWILPLDTQGISISEMAASMSFDRQRRPVPASDLAAPVPIKSSPENGPGTPLKVAQQAIKPEEKSEQKLNGAKESAPANGKIQAGT